MDIGNLSKRKEKLAYISASNIKQWLNCPASYHISRAWEEELGDEGIRCVKSKSYVADRGTFLHEVCKELIVNQLGDKSRTLEDAATAFNAFANLTEDEKTLCLNYRNFCLSFLPKQFNKENHRVFVERFFEGLLPQLTSRICVDFCFVDFEAQECAIVDLKTGQQNIAAEDNLQLIYYALSLARYFKLQEKREIKYFNLYIYQDNEEKMFLVSLEELKTKYAYVFESLVKTVSGDFKLSEGEHCQFCPCFTRCPIKTNHIKAARELMNKSRLSIEEQSEIVIHGQEIEKFIDKVKKETLNLVDSGLFEYPELEKVPAYSERDWTDTSLVIELLTQYNIEPFTQKDPSFICFSKAEKALREKIKDKTELKEKLQVLNSLSESKIKSFKLIKKKELDNNTKNT